MCPSYLDLASKIDEDDVSLHRPTMALFKVSLVAEALAKAFAHAQNTIRKTHWLISKFYFLQDCIHPLRHLVNFSLSLSRPSQRTISQICAPRSIFSVGHEYWCECVLCGQQRPEKVEEGCDHWNEDALNRTCKFDDVLVGINLVGSVKFIRWRVLNHCLVGQPIRNYEVWLNLALREYFTLMFLEDTAYRS